LHIGKRAIGSVNTSESVAIAVGQFATERSDILGWHYNVGVEYDQIIARRVLGSVVAAEPRSGIVFVEVLDIEALSVSLANIFASISGAVFDYYHLEILIGLLHKAAK
jgi:hypothetical protein